MLAPLRAKMFYRACDITAIMFECSTTAKIQNEAERIFPVFGLQQHQRYESGHSLYHPLFGLLLYYAFPTDLPQTSIHCMTLPGEMALQRTMPL